MYAMYAMYAIYILYDLHRLKFSLTYLSGDKEDNITFIDAVTILTGGIVAGSVGALVGVGINIFRKDKEVSL